MKQRMTSVDELRTKLAEGVESVKPTTSIDLRRALLVVGTAGLVGWALKLRRVTPQPRRDEDPFFQPL